MTDHEQPAIKIVLADNQHISRMGIRALLEDEPDISIVAETDNGREALRLAEKHKPDVLIVEMDLPDVSGIQIAVALSESELSVPVLALSAYDDQQYIEHTLLNGLSGYALKQDPAPHVIRAIREVAGGVTRWFTPRVARKVIEIHQEAEEKIDDGAFSPREWEVMMWMGEGLTTSEIANTLFLSPHTVRGHEAQVRRKQGTTSRSAAIAWIWKHGLKKSTGVDDQSRG